MDLYIKWKLRQIYKHFYTILIPLLFQFLQLLEQVCIFFFLMNLEAKWKLKEIQTKRNINEPPPMHATFTVETLHFSKD